MYTNIVKDVTATVVAVLPSLNFATFWSKERGTIQANNDTQFDGVSLGELRGGDQVIVDCTPADQVYIATRLELA